MTAVAPPRARHVLRVADLCSDELEQLLGLAAAMRASAPATWIQAHAGETLVALFEKPSTRTRVSFAAAAQRLGMLPLTLRGDELQLGRGETIADTARVLSSYASMIVVRTFDQERLEQLAAHATVPVVNALSDTHHPCQALADLLTLHEQLGPLTGVRLAYVGDGSNVAHSLLEAGARAGMHVVAACPPGFEPDEAIVAAAAEEAERHAGSVRVTSDPYEAVRGAHAVYADVWVSMGEEDDWRERREALAPYAVTERLMEHARPEAIFLHCLPAHRGEEVEASVVDGTRSRVFLQAANRLPTEQALVHWLLERCG